MMHIRDTRNPGHFWADNEVVDHYLEQIGVYGFAVYMLLARYADNKTADCDPSVATLARRLGVSEPTIRKGLQALQAAGLIAIEPREEPTPRGKTRHQTHRYRLLSVPKQPRACPRCGGGGQPASPGVGNDVDQGGQGALPGVENDVDQNGQPGCPPLVNQVDPNKTEINKTQGNKTESERRARAPQSPPASSRGGRTETANGTPPPVPPGSPPAVEVYRAELGRQPTADQVALIAAAGIQDLELWRQVCRFWRVQEFRRANVPGLLDRYRQCDAGDVAARSEVLAALGEVVPPAPRAGRGRATGRPEPRGYAGLRAAAAELGLEFRPDAWEFPHGDEARSL